MFKPTKSKLSIFFLVLTFLPLVVLRLVVYPITFQTIKEEIIKNLEIAAYKQAELVTQWMETCINDARGIAQNPFVVMAIQAAQGNAEQGEMIQSLDAIEYFDYLWKEYGNREISIADRNGNIRIAAKKGLVGTNIVAKDYFRTAMDGAFFTSNIIPSDTPIENETGTLESGAPTMLFAAPVKDKSNTIIGAVTIRIPVSEMNALMQNIHLGKTGETYLVNAQGYMLTESRFTQDLKEQQRIHKRSALELKITDPVTGIMTKGVAECIKGTDGFHADGYSDYRGIPVLGFWHWMPDYGWGVIAEIDVHEGYGAMYTLRNYIMFVFGLVAIGVIIIAFFLGKKISAPIRYLTGISKTIASGSYHTRAAYQSDDEVGELAQAINKMAEALEKRSQMPGAMSGEKPI